jgi:hypothetical protein
MNRCPHCNSSRIASRRQLFLCLMNSGSTPCGFDWYALKTIGALPPKSLFIQLLSWVLVFALPLLIIGYIAEISGATLLASAGMTLAAVLACLLADLLLTYGRYRNWAQEWVCGDCQRGFRPAALLLSVN